MATLVRCRSMPRPGTILAIQTESNPPYVWATYQGTRPEAVVPSSVMNATDMLVIRSDQAVRFFVFEVVATKERL
ncbi:MAG: hypothetical protein JO093_13470 [Acidobacteria bacterium]|nr:hypothetical protein [Acidobacteriota bacterium]